MKTVLDQIEIWLREQIILVPRRSAIGGYGLYSHPLALRLVRYINDGRFHIDNNRIENSIRPVALGRKNYLFAGSHEAAASRRDLFHPGHLQTSRGGAFAYLTKIYPSYPTSHQSAAHTSARAK
ncbi:MAG: transposase [Saprospiraceae bacterium]|nr:transposase [Saprospiraceae bacterium]